MGCSNSSPGGAAKMKLVMTDNDGDSGTYEGPVDAQCKAHGVGTLRFDKSASAGNSVFHGEFKNGRLFRGVLYAENGEVVDAMRDGDWVNPDDKHEDLSVAFPMPGMVRTTEQSNALPTQIKSEVSDNRAPPTRSIASSQGPPTGTVTSVLPTLSVSAAPPVATLTLGSTRQSPPPVPSVPKSLMDSLNGMQLPDKESSEAPASTMPTGTFFAAGGTAASVPTGTFGSGAVPTSTRTFAAGSPATAPSGTFAANSAAAAPSGTFAAGSSAPPRSGTFAGGSPAAAPSGTFAVGSSAAAPSGTFAAGQAPALVPSGTFAAGSSATAPSGTFAASQASNAMPTNTVTSNAPPTATVNMPMGSIPADGTSGGRAARDVALRVGLGSRTKRSVGDAPQAHREKRPEVVYKDGAKYTGEWAGELRDGFGAMVWPGNKTYEGQWQRGMCHGTGTFKGDDHRYEGTWASDTKHGQGTICWADGSSYVGELQMGLKHGRGVMKMSDESSYEGDYQDDLRHGEGRQVWVSCAGDYVGQWFQDRQHGRGRFILQGRGAYEGEFSNGKQEGYGCFIWEDGSKYDGMWVNELQHGVGVITTVDGKRFKSEWSEGTLVKWL